MMPSAVKPLISVLMTAYNESNRHFDEAVQSMLSQTYDNYEIILLIDNPENHRLIERAYFYEKRYRRLKVFVNKNNLGLARSLNKGLSIAKGDYICRMDSDDMSDKNRLDVQLSILEEKKYDLVGCCVNVIDENSHFLYNTGSLPEQPKKVNKALKWNNCIPHPSWFGKREVFNQKYRAVPLCEDYDFLLRASIKGYKLGNCSDSLLSYRMSKDSISRNNLYEQYLFQCFLSREFRNGRIADEDEIKKWVSSKKDFRKAERYTKANSQFNECMCLLSNGKYFAGLGLLLKIPMTSLSYLYKLGRLLISKSC